LNVLEPWPTWRYDPAVLNSLTAFDYVQALYRLVLIQAGRGAAAQAVVEETVCSAFAEAGQKLDALNFEQLFRSAFDGGARFAAVDSAELSGWTLALHRLPEPERSVLTIFYLEILDPETAARVVGLPLEQFAGLVAKGRTALAATSFSGQRQSGAL
jgi:hypothetical protein